MDGNGLEITDPQDTEKSIGIWSHFYLDLVLISCLFIMKRHAFLLLALIPLLLITPSCTQEKPTLVVYSGRGKALVEPILTRFTAETGIQLDVKYGGTTQLTVAVLEEGVQSPADLFWASDIGGLGALTSAGLLSELDDAVYENLDPRFVGTSNTWVAVSNRARVLAYSTDRVSITQLPTSVFDLIQPAFKGKVGWAPTNGTFQSFVSAMIQMHGRDATLAWLIGMKDNNAVPYANNNAIIQAIASGEVNFGITNHYYLLRAKKDNADFPVAQTFFASGDIGNMLNLAGIGILASSTKKDAAEQLIRFLLETESQEFFATETFEYPVVKIGNEALAVDSLRRYAPDVSLESIPNLDDTLALLREAGLL